MLKYFLLTVKLCLRAEKLCLLAITFLTRIPVPQQWFLKYKISTKDLAYSTLFYPVIGLLLGLFYWLVIYSFGQIIPREYLALLLIVLGLIITGALHEDGFADVFDAFGSQNKKENILRVMKDSRLGTYGTLALIVLILFKFLLLKDIPLDLLGKTIILAQVIPRWIVVPVMFFSPYSRDKSTKSKNIVENVKELNIYYLLASSIFTLIVAVLLFNITASLFIFLVIIIAIIAASYFQKKIGGITGDCLGFIEQLCELSIYILILLI